MQAFWKKIKSSPMILGIIASCMAVVAVLGIIFMLVMMSSGTRCGGQGDSTGESGSWGYPFKDMTASWKFQDGQGFGNVSGRSNWHDGIDVGTSQENGKDILAIHGGTVYKIGHSGTSQSSPGYYVCVKSDDGYYEVYQEFAFSAAQAAEVIKVKEGDTVKTGDVIGVLKSQSSPEVTHVHIGVSKTEIDKAQASYETDNGTWLDPMKVIAEGGGGSSSTSSDSDDGLDEDERETKGSSDSNDGDDVVGTATGAVSGDWTTQGTEKYNNAKALWDYWKNKGFSGVAISGFMGNVYAESGFDPKIVQGGGQSDNPASITGATGTNGYGLYQISPGSKYGTWSGYTSPTVENESDYVWEAYGGASVSNGLKNADSEVKNIQSSSTPEEAAKNFYKAVENGNVSTYSAASGSTRTSAAQTAYQLFDGADVAGDDSVLSAAMNAANTGASSENDDSKSSGGCSVGKNGSDDDDSDSDGTITSMAKSLVGYFVNGYPNPIRHTVAMITGGGSSIKSLSDVDKNGSTDCSGYVWLVLKLCGYNVPDNVGWYTGSMAEDAKGSHKWLKEVSSSDAKAGDIAIGNQGSGAGAAGHTVILAENYKGADTKVYSMGDDQGVIETTFGKSMGRFSGDQLTFAEAIKTSSSN
ncbi:phage tail tip lysozyme [Limosilactobacillus gastricus]|uniref:phage tail tip lysozyme n=1 Tax=Limosilactobacillus gastricus TaxID=227942 RepID=UPI0026EF9475|nr:phage tail tip lysozyme [Limosilactobacillus gastricus]